MKINNVYSKKIQFPIITYPTRYIYELVSQWLLVHQQNYMYATLPWHLNSFSSKPSTFVFDPKKESLHIESLIVLSTFPPNQLLILHRQLYRNVAFRNSKA